MARQGYGLCAKDQQDGRYVSGVYPRDCGLWARASQPVIDARSEWVKTGGRADGLAKLDAIKRVIGG